MNKVTRVRKGYSPNFINIGIIFYTSLPILYKLLYKTFIMENLINYYVGVGMRYEITRNGTSKRRFIEIKRQHRRVKHPFITQRQRATGVFGLRSSFEHE